MVQHLNSSCDHFTSQFTHLSITRVFALVLLYRPPISSTSLSNQTGSGGSSGVMAAGSDRETTSGAGVEVAGWGWVEWGVGVVSAAGVVMEGLMVGLTAQLSQGLRFDSCSVNSCHASLDRQMQTFCFDLTTSELGADLPT